MREEDGDEEGEEDGDDEGNEDRKSAFDWRSVLCASFLFLFDKLYVYLRDEEVHE